MNKLALFCLLLSGLLLLLVQSSAGFEETPRTSRFEPLERKNRFRNGGGKGGRMPKHRPSSGTTTTMATSGAAVMGERPRFHGYSSFLVKPSSVSQQSNGLILEAGGVRGGDVTSVSGLITGGGSLIQSTQLPPPHHSTNPQRNSEFLKGKSKKRVAQIFEEILTLGLAGWLAQRPLCLRKSKESVNWN